MQTENEKGFQVKDLIVTALFIFVRTCYLYPLCVPIFFSLHDVSGKSIVVIIGSYYIFPCSS